MELLLTQGGLHKTLHRQGLQVSILQHPLYQYTVPVTSPYGVRICFISTALRFLIPLWSLASISCNTFTSN